MKIPIYTRIKLGLVVVNNPFLNKLSRRYIITFRTLTRYRNQMTLARFKVCIKENRWLKSSEHIDHIDGDKTNDDIDNLQILTLS